MIMWWGLVKYLMLVGIVYLVPATLKQIEGR